MKDRLVWRMMALIMVVALAVPAGAAYATEQGAALSIDGSTTMTVGGRQVAAARQDERVTIVGSNFRFNELVGLWVTLPDGSVRGINRDNIRADIGGDFVAQVTLDGSYPTGLHHFSARGKTSGRGAIAPVNVMAGGTAPTAGTEMRVVPESAVQLQSVELYASGFAARENVHLWLTRPDGAVVGLGVRAASRDGRIALELRLPASLPVGRHVFAARGNTSGAKATASFELRQGHDLETPATITGHFGSFQQRTTVDVRGAGFRPRESVNFWLTKPNGAVVGLGDRNVDARGALSTTLYLSEALPTGRYHLSYRSNISQQVQFIALDLDPGPRFPGQE